MKIIFRMLIAVLLVFSISVTGCISVHRSPETLDPEKKFALSCMRHTELDAGNIVALLCTYENKTKQWQELRVASIKFGQSAVAALDPQQVQDYVDAVSFRNEMRDHNTRAVLGGLVLVGYAAALGSGSSSGRTAGAATAAVGGLGMLGRELGEARDAATQAGVSYGSQHLMGPTTRVPGELFVRKALLIETAGTPPAEIDVCLEAPVTGCVRVMLQGPYDRRMRRSAQNLSVH